MRLRRTPSFVVLCSVVLGCAYYNGLYNANRLAGEAQKAEREGRRSEAQSLWAQAAVKAESVATRYPTSKYRDDALLMQGRALQAIGECRDAIAPLEEAVVISPDLNLRAQAGLLLGECQLVMGQPEAAVVRLSPVVDHPDPLMSSQALLWRGRAAMARGEPAVALPDFRRTAEPVAVFDRAAAFTALGQVDEAASALDTALGLAFDEAEWTPVLEALGRVNRGAASALVQRLTDRRDLTSGERARLLMADAQRWATVDPAHARDRFTAAVSAAGDSLEGRVARAHLAMAEARQTTDLDRVVELTDELGALMLEGGEVINLAGHFADMLDGIVFALGPPEPVHPDLHLFRSAEEARDSLWAEPLAGRLFLLVAERYPGSVIAPKALLAAAALRPEIADSVGQVLTRQYASSPYVGAAAGDYPPEYTAVEDSIRTLMNNVVLRSR
jgi:tetratricopeptide (TPR) repeat protein